MPSHKAVIAGIGESDVGVVPDRTSISLCADAVAAALADAGLTLRNVDGLLCAAPLFRPSPRYHMVLAESLGLFTKTLCDSLSMGGASPCAALRLASWAVESGQCQTVVVVAGDTLRSGVDPDGTAAYASMGAHSLDYEFPYGAHIPAFYALLAQRYLHEYGLDDTVFDPVSVAMRRHAVLNPRAQMRTPITLDDVRASTMVSSPLRKLHCSLVSDGAAAYVVTRQGASRDAAREVAMLGLGQAHSTYHMGHLVRGDASHDLVRTVCDVAGRQAFGEAGLSPEDIDVAQIYDSFAITLMVQLEDLGFCGRGEAAGFVADGGIELGGRLPLNTHGGLLSCAHPGVPGGMLHLNEGVRQVRGEAEDRQVEGARTALVTSASAVASNYSVAILAAANR
ncbi:thiolase family protein [Pseudonocardia kunmingensis]|uniref:Acetyl-CoA acetyltransferase n=1 Tax=Pseudonocardia kunmingensis TaxID=630975 RepID=A0A543DP37_9PSEU|nr:thiolase family protein [Pseudonocardia kunmingensis]TQM11079.1 acetyl-CoA acetyltransferase [Pseudonocardia kunmingensis]